MGKSKIEQAAAHAERIKALAGPTIIIMHHEGFSPEQIEKVLGQAVGEKISDIINERGK